MKSFQARAKSVLKAGDLTLRDLEHWFARAHTTVWRWVHSGWVPRNPGATKAERDLTTLEALVAKGKVFPIPYYISGKQRKKYVEGAYHAAAGVPKARSAR